LVHGFNIVGRLFKNFPKPARGEAVVGKKKNQ